MKTYLVGGAVRNELLGLAVTERDWVVVGSTEQAMLSDGYTQVGKDFPVFLHPKTKEEYALARTERKTGPGHQGFVCNADPSVTLEEDLARRDLTINAIAQDEAGARVDPYGGLKDIDAKILRHVSPAFIEDPLRVLRVARFLATLAHLGFKVAPETTDLLQSMVDEGMLTELAPERIFAEVTKAMKTSSPAVFFSYLASINANEVLWPEISSQAVARLERITSATDNLSPMADLRFISLAAGASETEISALCSRLKCSKQISELSLMLTKHLDTWQRLNGLDAFTSSDSLSAAQIYEHLEKLDAFRRQDRFTLFGKIADLVTSSQAADIWQLALSSALTVSAKSIPEDIKGPAIGTAIKTARIAAIEAALAP